MWGVASDSSRSYSRGMVFTSRWARCSFSGDTVLGRDFAESPTRLGSLAWIHRTTLAQTRPEPHVKLPSRRRRLVQRFLGRIVVFTLIVLMVGCGAPGPIMPGSSTTPPSTTSTASNPTAYRVVGGDTLYSIAFRYGLDWREIARWNAIDPPYTIQVGQRLRLRPPVGTITATTTTDGSDLPGETSTLGTPPRPVESRPIASGSTGSEPAIDQDEDTARVPLPPITAPPRPAPETRPEPRPSVTRPSATEPQQEAPASSADVVTTGSGRNTAGATWFWPTEGRLTRRFNASDTRKGIHIAGENGQPIRATANGEVVYSGNGLIGYGELIIIKHTDSMLSAYAHNRERLVEQGDRVQAGQLIAHMGEFEPNRPLLHFEIRRNGQPDDPVKYLPER